MRRMYQTEWQGIRFSDFARMSPKRLASPDFYQAFYDEFFRRYGGWEQLSSSWCKQKERSADFVLARGGGDAKILSVGCGLGVMEHYLGEKASRLDLFIHEVAPSAWRWVGAEFAEDHKFVGMIPACLPEGTRFDLAYLSAVDYALDDDALIHLLAAIRPFLCSSSGQCLLISASFQDSPGTFKEKAISLVRGVKTFAAAALDNCGLRSRGQFWGWSRTQEEYRSLMVRAGYRDIEDGFIDSDKRTQYWVAGR